MSARRFTSMVLVSLCVVAGGLLLVSAPALALNRHVFDTTFGEEGSGNGQFKRPDGVAVNDTTHDVYVVDSGNNRVEQFAVNPVTKAYEYIGQFNGSAAPTGAFDDPTTIAVDNSPSPFDPSAGDVYVVDQGHNVVDKFSAAGIYEGQLTAGEGGVPFSELEGVAVDPSGVLWVTQDHKLDSFSDALVNVFLSEKEGGALTLVVNQGLAVDSEDRLYIAGNQDFRRLQGGETEFFFPGEHATGIAVDTSNDEVYAAIGESGGTRVDAYAENATGAEATIEQFGAGDLTGGSGVAVDSSSHRVYVADAAADRVAIFDNVVLPDVSTGAEVTNLGHEGTVTLNGTVDPDGEPVTSCQFEYGTETSYGSTAPCEPAPGSGSGPVAVHADVSGLTPLTSYHYRLVAGDANGSDPGFDKTFIAPARPRVEGVSVLKVTSGSAELIAQINPGGSDSTYRFEYGPTADYGTSVPGDAGAGTSAVPARLLLQDLQPGSTYHFRVVVGNAVQREVAAVDQEFSTQSEGGEFTLPDGRAWEMVTPSDEHGADLIALGNEAGDDIQAAQAGDGITYGATAPFVANPAGSRSPEVTQVISLRGAPGVWSTQDITTPHNEGATQLATGHTAEYKLFSSDLSLGFVEPAGDTPLPPLPAGSEKTVYLREAGGGYEALVSSGNVPPGCEFGGDSGPDISDISYEGSTQDMKYVILGITPKCPPPSVFGGLYEWSEGRLAPVDVLPDGEETHSGGSTSVSNDGSLVAWEYEEPSPPAPQEGFNALYLRDMTRGETIQVTEGKGSASSFLDRDGSRLFYTSGGSFDVFEVSSGAGEPLAGKSTALVGSGGIEGLLGTSEDGTYVYFVDSEVLGDGAGHGAESGGPNIYLERYDEAAKAWAAPVFIALLSGDDSPDWNAGGISDSTKTSRLSPNGRYLAFMSQRSLTGYENRDANSGVADEEVFLYDADTSRLVCASCNPTGARPVGLHEGGGFEENLVDYAKTWEGRWFAANIPGWTSTSLKSALYQSRYLSDSGRLFFNSSDALVPGDVNGREDVYEYEPVGFGSCRAPGYGQSASVVYVESQGGCVGLISAGTSSEESAFMDASETGGDVFFLQTHDRSLAIYDAHECSAAAPCAPPSAVPPPPCATGDSCKAAPSPQPAIFGAPASETFTGTGNLASSTPTPTIVKKAKCAKGKVRDKRGKCVKRAKAKTKTKAKKASNGRRGK